jgi:hypothetical protein
MNEMGGGDGELNKCSLLEKAEHLQYVIYIAVLCFSEYLTAIYSRNTFHTWLTL